jgi:capsular polysaccharide biosynthesis protein/Tfp pilus assembly protein PilF
MGDALQILALGRQYAPDDPPLNLLAGQIYLERGMMANAQSLFDHVAKCHPDQAQAYLGLARVALIGGVISQALGFLIQALALDPSFMDVLFELAGVHKSLGNLRQQVNLFSRAAYMGAGMHALDQWALALIDLTDFISADQVAAQRMLHFGPSPILILALAAEALERDQFNAAQDGFKSAIALNPHRPDAWTHLGITCIYANDIYSGRPAFARGAQLGDASAAQWVRLLDGTPLAGEQIWQRVPIDSLGSNQAEPDFDLNLARITNGHALTDKWYIEGGPDHPGLIALPYLQNDSSFLTASTRTGKAISPIALEGDAIDQALVLGDSANYYHWLIDDLPNFGLLKQRNLPGPILFGHHITGFHFESLAKIGLDPDRLHYVEFLTRRPVRDLTVFHRPQIKMPISQLMSGVVPAITYRRAEWLRSAFGGPEQKTGDKRIYISRAGTPHRSLSNEPQVLDMLKQRGFDCYPLGSMSLADQAALFSQAEIAIGPHGAGFTNMVFAPRGAKILELIPNQDLPPYFLGIAQAVGLEHFSLTGQLTRSAKPRTRSWWHFEIDVKQLARQLDDLGIR